MPPKPTLYERYRTLGLAIEAAIVLDDWSDVGTMLEERDRILDQLQSERPSMNQAEVSMLAESDHRMLRSLIGMKTQTVLALKDLFASGALRKAYRPVGPASSVDQSG